MISKKKEKLVISLQKKKVRDEEGLFVIEGDKLVKEFLSAGIQLARLIAKPEFIASLSEEMKQLIGEIEPAGYEELKRMSTLKTPHNAIAVVPQFIYKFGSDPDFSGLTVALDCIQDPGNLGTIIRAASWFGIKNVFCSYNCVDVYNPKVIQSTMGAILNTVVRYGELKDLLTKATMISLPVYGTMLEGDSVYSQPLGKKGIILLGNESKGISEDLLPFITTKLKIPRFISENYGTESLNVAMAASVIFSEFARRD
jgi:RNA methyltransferase, TrmH family